jgi:hypothetical protein
METFPFILFQIFPFCSGARVRCQATLVCFPLLINEKPIMLDLKKKEFTTHLPILDG